MTAVPALQGSYAVVDTETTDLSYKRGGRIIEVAVVHIDNGEITDTWSSLINPGAGVSPGETRIHRITRDMLDPAPSFSELVGTISGKLDGRILVAHNAQFDIPYLRNEYRLAGYEMPKVPHMCTKEGSRYLLPQLPSHRLGSMCEHFSINLDGWHAAEADTVAAAQLHLKLMQMVPHLQVEVPAVGMWPAVETSVAGLARA